MASARFAWGIDIGNRALKAVKLVRDGDKLRVDDFELIEHEHVLSNAGDNKESLIQTALANFVQRHPMKKGGVVAVGVAGQSSFARFIKLPPVEPKRIPEIVKFEAIQQIPFPLDDVEWGYQLFQTPESPDVEVGIFAMRKELIARHIKFFTDFDMNVQVVQMNPLAVYNAMYYDQRLKGTTMVIDLGAENTDLIICDNDTIWMRSIPIGGNNFTETLVKGFKLPFAKAEDLKRNAATSKYARQIFQAMRPVFADLVAEIQRSVGFYASVHRDSRIKKIIALGGTFRLPGLQKYLQQNLSLDVDRLDTLSAGAPADPKLAATFNENLLSAVSAYGLAAQAMGEGKITSSLLPASIRREKLWKEKTPIFASAAAMFCVGTGIALGGYFIQDAGFESAADKRENIQRVQTQATSADTAWSAIEGAGGSERSWIKNIKSYQAYRDLWPHLIKDIENALPKPQKAILDGIANNDPSLIKSIPRGQREMIMLRSIASVYNASIGTVLKYPENQFKDQISDPFSGSGGVLVDQGNNGGGGGGGDAADQGGLFDETPTQQAGPVGKDGQRGFVITIRGSTPNAKGNLVVDAFLTALSKIKPDANRPNLEYEFKKGAICKLSTVRTSPYAIELGRTYQALVGERLAAMGDAQSNAIKNRQRANGAAPVDDPSPFRDRLVGDEDVRDDTDFTLLIVVTMDPAPFTPPAPTAAPEK